MKKKFVATMYLYQNKAVKGINDTTVLSDDPVLYARTFFDNNLDEILIYDMSTTDAEHDEAISMIKKICLSCEMPVIGSGHVHRMEDIKKLLYAGCARAVLDFENEENIGIAEEVGKKFGKDKLLAAVSDVSTYKANQIAIQAYTNEVIYQNDDMKDIMSVINMPVMYHIPAMSLEKMLEYLSQDMISGVTGDYINEIAGEITSIKSLCFEKGIPVYTFEGSMPFSEYKLNSDGMIPVVVQDYKTNQVLQVAYMNEESYNKTLKTGKMTYWSRSRNELWTKGETSGHFQYVKELIADCDKDTLVAKVSQVGAACHTGSYSCFFQQVAKKEYANTNPLQVFEDVFAVIMDRKVNPKEGSYTNYLFDKGVDKILKKLGEEATEIVIAAKNPNPDEIKYEISDFLYHMMVLMAEKNVTWEEITQELARR
ncbi:MAG: bifunctional phosphoribosyl-AMP cyclohydrolase/phosphoribosyl-ATP diphosphatase HisIE [Lachnospiraceae bacterium]|nr:bifunctional phosphoribosyl-AMP cyclohydrolase/phosphoribosyl-ATP diphosphatase HisIE [Lachnospiraceae bacterium]